MHPDRRRAGRAIRKQRRLTREAVHAFSAVAVALPDLLAAFARGFAEATAQLAAFAEAVAAVGEPQHELWKSEDPIVGREITR